MGKILLALMIAVPALAQVRVKENIKQYDLGEPAPQVEQQQSAPEERPAPQKKAEKPKNDAVPKQ